MIMWLTLFSARVINHRLKLLLFALISFWQRTGQVRLEVYGCKPKSVYNIVTGHHFKE